MTNQSHDIPDPTSQENRLDPQPITHFPSRFLLSLASPAVLLAAPSRAGGQLSDDEAAEILDLLRSSRSDTLAKLAALSDEQWSFKPAPDRWSAGEVAEHLYLAEQVFHSQVDALMKAAPSPDWDKQSEGKVQTLTQVIPDRSNRAQAPPPAVPKGQMSRTQVVESFVAARSRMIGRVLDRSKAYKAHIGDSGTPLGDLSAAHWLRFAALHNQRHNKQIDEVLADPKFPA